MGESSAKPLLKRVQCISTDRVRGFIDEGFGEEVGCVHDQELGAWSESWEIKRKSDKTRKRER